jgi:hypothetical protein
LVCDRLYGTPKEEISSRSLEWGTEAEPFARKAYEEETGLIVKDAPFVKHSLNPFVGASPDGLVGDDGGIEGKAPKDRKIHIRTFSEGMPANHLPQVQGCMWVTGRKWWDFISFDPRPEAHPEFRLYIQRIQRDDIYIAKLEETVSAFLAEVNVTVTEMLEKIGKAA